MPDWIYWVSPAVFLVLFYLYLVYLRRVSLQALLEQQQTMSREQSRQADISRFLEIWKKEVLEINISLDELQTGQRDTAVLISKAAQSVEGFRPMISFSEPLKRLLDHFGRLAENYSQLTPVYSRLNKQFREAGSGWATVNQSITTIYESSRSISSRIDQLAAQMSDGRTLLQNNISMMGQISESVKGIHYILEVIGDISDETNMLSINAAIEAYHAGESGSGFSVVAEEIRQVALLTVREAERIEKIISQVNVMTDQDVETVQSIEGIFSEFSRNIEKLFIYVLNVTSTAQELKSRVETINKSDRLWDESTLQDSTKKLHFFSENMESGGRQLSLNSREPSAELFRALEQSMTDCQKEAGTLWEKLKKQNEK